MKITFQEIRFSNVFSFGQNTQTIRLDSHPTTLFLGENGSGKSSAISDTMSFALYGRAHRDINKTTIANTVNDGKKARVELDFKVGLHQYKIVRGIKPNVFEIWKDGNLVPQSGDSRVYQEYLETDVLRMNFKTFCQIVILGKASFTPFMQLGAPERRKIIEDLLDIRVFTVMNAGLKTRKDKLEIETSKTQQDLTTVDHHIGASERLIAEINQSSDTQVKDHEAEIGRLTRAIAVEDVTITDVTPKIEQLRKDITFGETSYEAGRKDLEQEYNTLISDKDKEIAAAVAARQAEFKPLNDELATFKTEIARLRTEYTKRSAAESHIQKLKDLGAQIRANSKRVEDDVAFFRVNDVCPTCTQAISGDKKAEKITEADTKVAEYADGLTKLADQVAKATEKLAAFDAIQVAIEEQNANVTRVNNTILTKTSEIRVFEGTLQSTLNTLKAEFKQKQAELKTASDAVLRIHRDDLATLSQKLQIAVSSKSSLEGQIRGRQAEIIKLKTPKGSLTEEIAKLDLAKTQKGELLDGRETQLRSKQVFDVATLLLKDTGIKARVIKQYLPVLNQLLSPSSPGSVTSSSTPTSRRGRSFVSTSQCSGRSGRSPRCGVGCRPTYWCSTKSWTGPWTSRGSKTSCGRSGRWRTPT